MLKYHNLKDSQTKMGLLCHYLALEPVDKKKTKKTLFEKYLRDVCRFPNQAPALAQEQHHFSEKKRGRKEKAEDGSLCLAQLKLSFGHRPAGNGPVRLFLGFFLYFSSPLLLQEKCNIVDFHELKYAAELISTVMVMHKEINMVAVDVQKQPRVKIVF